MSWQKNSIKVILSLPLALPIISYAINVGDTFVQSQQNQPLHASIDVSDIDPENFSVKIANTVVYQQLGLSNDNSVSVMFQQTGKNSGKIILTTKQPINTPFADIILDIQNHDEKKLLPKTLLMPLDDSQKITPQSEDFLIKAQPTTVNIGESQQIELPVTSNDETNQTETTQTSEEATTDNSSSDTVVVQNQEVPITINVISPVKEETDDSQHLTIQETREYIPLESSSPPVTTVATVEEIPTDTSEPTEATVSDNNPSSEPEPEKSEPEEEVTASDSTTEDKTETETDETITYIIQRNDNLWTIANKIAKKNKTDVNSVMKAIVAKNPDVFKNGDASKIDVKTPLILPKYEVMPSQFGIKSAKAVQQHSKKVEKTEKVESKKTSKSTSHKTTTTHSNSTHTQHTHHKTASTKAKAKPTRTQRTKAKRKSKSEMTIIVANKHNGSAQGSTQSSNSKNLSPQMLAQIKQKRQTTAKQANRVKKLNTQLVSAENKLKIQNSKLAQLEKRLKELNKK